MNDTYVDVAAAYRLVEPLLRPEEGLRPRQQDVEEHTAAPDVRRLSVRPPQDDLGSHEVGSANTTCVHAQDNVRYQHRDKIE